MDKSDVSLASQRFSEFWAAPLLILLSMTCSAYWCSGSLYAQQHGFNPFGNSLSWVFQGGGQEGFQVSYMGIHVFSAVGCGLSHCENVLFPSRILGRSLLFLQPFQFFSHALGIHNARSLWIIVLFLQPYSCTETTTSAEHKNQILNAKFVGPAKWGLCCKFGAENSK